MASRYPLNLPLDLKRAAEQIARQQGISLNQLILWSVAEKVSELQAGLDDPRHPHVAYRRGAAGIPAPILRGTSVRVQTLVIANERWGESTQTIAKEYSLLEAVVVDALAFYQDHRQEIDLQIRLEENLEQQHAAPQAAS
jgi:uncharacterized protein (DUF433 family)